MPLRELSRMERLASISRSGGLDIGNDSLTDYKTQHEFRQFIEEKIEAFKDTYNLPIPTPDEPAVAMTARQREALSNILILLRKLREGIVASRRVDAFAVEVYETSARLAVHAQDHSMLAGALASLVPGLYNDQEEHTLAASLAGLRMDRTRSASTSVDRPANHDEFVALYLLHILVTDYPSQHEYMKKLQSLPSWLTPESSPHLQLVQGVSEHLRRHNHWALGRIVLDPPDARSPLVQSLLISLLSRVRTRVWATTASAYRELARGTWLRTTLGFSQDGALDSFLNGKIERGELAKKDNKYIVVRSVRVRS